MSQSGGSVEGLQMGFKTLVNSVDQAIEGTGKGADSFAALGVSVKDASGNVKDQETIFNESVVALQNMEDGTEKAKLANDLFGRSGAEMMPLLNGAAGSIDEMKNKAHELGLVIGDDAVDAGVQFTDTMDQLQRSFGAAAASIGVSVMPLITKFADFIIANMPTIQAVMGAVFGAISKAVGFAAGVIQNSFGVLKNLYDYFSQIKGLFKDDGQAGRDFLSTLGFSDDLIGKIDAWAQNISAFRGSISETMEGIRGLFKDDGGGGRDILRSLGFTEDFIQKADDMALKILFVRDIVQAAVSAIRSYWEQNGSAIIAYVQDLFKHIQTIVETVIGFVVPFIQQKLAQIMQFWQQNGTQIMEAVSNAFNFIKSVIDFVMPAILAVVKMVWTAISGAISGALNVIMGLVKVFSGLFTGDFKKMWEGVKQMFFGAIQFIWNAIQLTFFGRILSGAKAFIAVFRSSFAALWAALKSLFQGNATAIMNLIRNAWTSIQTTTSSVFGFIKNFLVNTWNSIKSMVSSSISALVTSVSTGMNNAKNRITEIWGNVMSFFKGINLFSMGKDIIQGLINGIKGMAGSLLRTVKSLVTDNIPGPIKKIMGIASPSKLMHQYGEWTGEGLEDGMEDSTGGINKASIKLAKAAMPPLEKLFPNTGASRSLLKASSPAQVASASTVERRPQQPIVFQSVLDGRVIAESTFDTSDSLFGTASNRSEWRSGVRV